MRITHIPVKLSDDCKSEIELVETYKSVGRDWMLHIWADVSLTFEDLKLIIKTGIKHLPQDKKEEIINRYMSVENE